MSLPPVSTLGIDTLIEYLESNNCIFRDIDEFKSKLTKLTVDGPSRLSIISDFDFTLTKYYKADGISRADSCHASLENAPKNGLLPESYTTRAKELQSYYYPKEIDSTITETDKFRYMEEWVEKHNALLVESKITPRTINLVVSNAVDEKRLVLRQGLVQLVSLLEQQDIPTLIFSAGIADVVEVAIKKTLGGLDTLPSCLSLISNKCIFHDENDFDSELKEWSAPPLHVLNKRASSFLDHGFFKSLASSSRSNLILLGDSMGDPRMSSGIEDQCETIVKIGFLNVAMEERKKEFLELYDVAILGDPELDSSLLPILQLIIIQLQ